MPVKTDNQVKLKNGFSIGYTELGDPHGKPLLHFHGLPGSRFDGNNPHMDEMATRLGARVLVVERPGIGLSDYQPYTITSWPDLVCEFVDSLGLDQFAVMGVSSGGKYAAACAWKIPERLRAAGIVSGNCPYNLPGARETLSGQDRLMYWSAEKAPWLLGLILGKIARDARKNPANLRSLFKHASRVDQAAIAHPSTLRQFDEMMTGAFQQGTRGPILDFKLEAHPWGFSLGDIRIPVHVWHGEQDRIVPVEQGRLMAKAIPNARTIFHPGDGHMTMISNHYEEILSTLVG
jgi:pimeloyl-ACP methyl ester carboxylesterase